MKRATTFGALVSLFLFVFSVSSLSAEEYPEPAPPKYNASGVWEVKIKYLFNDQ